MADPVKPEAFKCKGLLKETGKPCQNTWLEQVKLKQFIAFHNVVLGQGVPELSQFEVFVLKCPRCGTLHDPSVELSHRNIYYKAWRQALEELGLGYEDPVSKQQPIPLAGNKQ